VRAEAVRVASAVAAGSALGAVARYGLSLWLIGLMGPGFAWGTLVANALGSFLIGLYAALAGPGARVPAGPVQQAFVMAGFCGGFTTFSIFSLEAVTKVVSGGWGLAGAFVAASALLWAVGVLAGHGLGRRIEARPRRRT
jgi:fluoride exporter